MKKGVTILTKDNTCCELLLIPDRGEKKKEWIIQKRTQLFIITVVVFAILFYLLFFSCSIDKRPRLCEARVTLCHLLWESSRKRHLVADAEVEVFRSVKLDTNPPLLILSGALIYSNADCQWWSFLLQLLALKVWCRGLIRKSGCLIIEKPHHFFSLLVTHFWSLT